MIRTRRYLPGSAAGVEVDATSPDAFALVDGGFVWVDVAVPTPDDIARVAAAFDVHELAHEDLLKGRQRTKLERYPGHFHVALHDCVLGRDGLVQREIDLVFGEGWLISVAAADGGGDPAAVMHDARERFERDAGSGGAGAMGALLWAIFDVIVDRYFVLGEAVDERLEDIEDVVFGAPHDTIPRELFELRRSLVSFRRASVPLRDVVGQILRRDVPQIDDAALLRFQDVYDHVLRISELLDTQREILTGLLEAQLAIMSNNMNAVMKATSSWGAILIVATLVAGIYGMNFRNMPELDWRLGYPFALGLMAVITGLLYRVFRRRGWL